VISISPLLDRVEEFFDGLMFSFGFDDDAGIEY
jgi:hypothetical protein